MHGLLPTLILTLYLYLLFVWIERIMLHIFPSIPVCYPLRKYSLYSAVRALQVIHLGELGGAGADLVMILILF